VGDYKPGVRSIEAIIEMSHLAQQDRYVKASLPPLDQLNLHVDGQRFLELLSND
jgi:hypothetical protein